MREVYVRYMFRSSCLVRRGHPLYSEAVGFRTFAGQKRDSLKSLHISRFSGSCLLLCQLRRGAAPAVCGRLPDLHPTDKLELVILLFLQEYLHLAWN
nr:hypothetical protein [uncultured bacterium]